MNLSSGLSVFHSLTYPGSIQMYFSCDRVSIHTLICNAKQPKEQTNPALVLEIGHLGPGGLLRVPDGAAGSLAGHHVVDQGRVNSLLEALEVDIQSVAITIVELEVVVWQLAEHAIVPSAACPDLWIE